MLTMSYDGMDGIYSLVESFEEDTTLVILFYRYWKRKREWEKNTIRNTFIEIGKKKKKKNGRKHDTTTFRQVKYYYYRRLFVSYSLLIAKRGGCGLIELAQCLCRGVAEQDMPFVCTASAVRRILYERWNFVFSRMWKDGSCCFVNDKGRTVCNSSWNSERIIFFFFKSRTTICSKTNEECKKVKRSDDKESCIRVFQSRIFLSKNDNNERSKKDQIFEK